MQKMNSIPGKSSVMRALLLLIFFLVHQPALAQFGFGPEASAGASTMLFKPDNLFTSSASSSAFSYRVGGIIDAPFTQHIYFQSGLFLSRKGQKRSFSFYYNDSLNNSEQQTLHLSYIDLPLNIVFKSGKQGKGRVFLGLGATLSYLIIGKNQQDASGKAAGVPFDVHLNEVIKQGKVVRAFDVGGSFYAGYELPTGLYFKLYFVPGIKDLGFGSEIDKNRMWGVSAGCFFGKGRNANKDTDGLIVE